MRIRFVNKFFNRFFEKTITNIPYERLITMNYTDRIILRDKKLIDATLEQKLMMLAKCGKPFALVVGDTNKIRGKDGLKRLVDLFYRKGSLNLKDGVMELKQAGFFFISDVDVVKSCNLLSTIYSDPVLHGLVDDFSEINSKLYARASLENKSEKELSALYDIDRLMSKIFAAAMSPKYMKLFRSKTKISAKEYRVLTVVAKNRVMKLRDVIKSLDTNGTTAAVQALKEREMLTYVGNAKAQEVMITGYGEVILSEARNLLLSEVY